MPVFEDVVREGHLIDSLILPQVLDDILASEGTHQIVSLEIGHGREDVSRATIRIAAETDRQLEQILSMVQRHGAAPAQAGDARTETVQRDGVLPLDFYSTTNLESYVRLHGRWVGVAAPEMDCAILVDPEAMTARTVPMIEARRGDQIVVGRSGIRVVPLERDRRGRNFEFMTSTVSSEKPKALVVGEVSRLMRSTREAGQKIIAVAGPAVVHTGSAPALARLAREGWVDVVFGGNAIAAHDIEVALFGTSLGVSVTEGTPVHGGHEHHLRAINRIRAEGGISQAVQAGVLREGLFYELVKAEVPFVLAGSVRDDGPLPEVITDVIEAQSAMRAHVGDAGLCLMLSTMLHSIATGNLLPARVHTVCVDINPAVVTKLADRGSFQAIGVVTDVGLFLDELADRLAEEG